MVANEEAPARVWNVEFLGVVVLAVVLTTS